MNNFVHLSPRIKRIDRSFNKLNKGDKLTVIIGNKTISSNDYIEIEIEPIKVITIDERTINVK